MPLYVLITQLMSPAHMIMTHMQQVNTLQTCNMYSASLRLVAPSCSSLFFQLKNKFMKKIPRDAEASNVMIGEVDFLDKPFVSFVRLAQATTLGGLTEVPVPTRCVSRKRYVSLSIFL